MEEFKLDYDYIAVCISAGRKENYSHLRNYLNEAKAHQMQIYLENNSECLYDVMQSLSNDEVVGIIRSFIVAEKFVSSWPKSVKNPAFVLYKQLIRRAPELRNDIDAWIKLHTNAKCYLHYKLGKNKSALAESKLSGGMKLCIAIALFGVAFLFLIPVLSSKYSFLASISMLVIMAVYSLLAILLFLMLYGFLASKALSARSNKQSDDIFEMIELRKDRARSLGIPDLFGFLFHKHLKFYPKWLAQGQKDKISPLISDISKDSDDDLNFVLNGHKYKIIFLEHQMFSSVDNVAALRADFELYSEDDKVLALKMIKEGHGYDSSWEVVDITAFKEGEWYQDFLDLEERIEAKNDKSSQKSQEEKVNKMKSDFGL